MISVNLQAPVTLRPVVLWQHVLLGPNLDLSLSSFVTRAREPGGNSDSRSSVRGEPARNDCTRVCVVSVSHVHMMNRGQRSLGVY